MKIIIKTTYENVNDEFLDNWLSQVGALPELHDVQADLRNGGKAVFVSKDPDSDCVGKTEYWIEK